MKEISFIHAADLHLDSPFQGLSSAPERIFQEIRKSTFIALEHLVDVAIQKQVDFVLLVGDIFDQEAYSLQAQIRLRNAFRTLAKHDITVYLSYGNHDFIQGHEQVVSFPENVFVFPDENINHFTYYKKGEALAQIYGFSYESRVVQVNKAKCYQIKDKRIPFHIASLHGSIYGDTSHDVYAPFHIRDLMQTNFDYWALGHIHKCQILKRKPPIVYPGNIQGRHRNETGAKGCFHVKMTETEETLTFIPLHTIEFIKITLDVSHCFTIDELERFIQQQIASYDIQTPLLIDLLLKNTNHIKRVNHYDITELIDLINETMIEQKNWRYIFSLFISNPSNPRAKIEDHFIQEINKQVDNIEMDKTLANLFQHRQARKYLHPLTMRELELIKHEAKELLLHKLIGKD